MNQTDTLRHTQEEQGIHIEIHEDDGVRWLQFGDGAVQSAIDLNDPQRLVTTVNQAMLAGLIFLPPPQQTLLLGTGGGALARYLAHCAPDLGGKAIEISPAIAGLARQFFDFPGPDTQWTLVVSDAREYVARSSDLYDLVLLDIAEGLRSPRWLHDPAFLHQCRNRLSPQGMLVINLMPESAEDFARALAPIRKTFPDCTLCLSVPAHRNVLVFGFHHRPEETSPTQLRQRLPALTQQWGLPFEAFLTRMQAENPVGSGIL